MVPLPPSDHHVTGNVPPGITIVAVYGSLSSGRPNVPQPQMDGVGVRVLVGVGVDVGVGVKVGV